MIKKIKKIADEFHKTNPQTGKQDKYVMSTIIQGLRTQIEEGKIDITTIGDALDRKYRLEEKSTRTKKKPRTVAIKEEDLLDKGIDFLRNFAGLKPEQIYRMSLSEFLQKMETYYSIELQMLNNHDIHLMSKTLDYLVVGTRKMLEMTEAKRAALRSQEDSGIGEV